jgi:hypothetical protein
MQTRFLKSTVVGVVLMVTIALGSFIVFVWSQQPLLFERLDQLEADAHKNWALNNLDLAYDGFLELISHAESENEKDRNVDRLRSIHIFAGRISQQNNVYDAAVKHFLIALELNPDDSKTIGLLKDSVGKSDFSGNLDIFLTLPKNNLSDIFKDHKTLFSNRYSDGWTKGENSSMLIHCSENACAYSIDFFVPHYADESALVELSHNGEKIFSKQMRASEKNQVNIEAPKGVSKLDLSINKVILLSKTDGRFVGFNYRAIILR